jgi:imidazolonepropionase-like amidohydrolase
VLIRGARLLDLQTGAWSPPQDILVERGRISWTAPAGSRQAPAGVRALDAAGQFAIPGLIDMHAHYKPWMGPLMDRFGVTTMRDLGSDPGVDWILDEREFIRAGHVQGPSIFAAGVIVNGSGAAGRIGAVLTDREDVLRDTITWLADAGVDHVKIGSENTEATLRTIVAIAHARGLPVWGHIAIVPVRQAIAIGQDGIEHLRGLGWGSLPDRDLPVPVPRRLTGMRRESAAWWQVSPDDVRALAQHMVERKVGWDPTLTVTRTFSNTALPEPVRALLPPAVLERWDRAAKAGPMPGWAPEDTAAFSDAAPSQGRFVQAYHAAGGPLLTGSDIGVDLIVPGLSIHQEMARFVALGVPPLDALRAATSHAARVLRAGDRLGALASGYQADVILLGADPLADIANTQQIRWVLRAGRIVREPRTAARVSAAR